MNYFNQEGAATPRLFLDRAAFQASYHYATAARVCLDEPEWQDQSGDPEFCNGIARPTCDLEETRFFQVDTGEYLLATKMLLSVHITT